MCVTSFILRSTYFLSLYILLFEFKIEIFRLLVELESYMCIPNNLSYLPNPTNEVFSLTSKWREWKKDVVHNFLLQLKIFKNTSAPFLKSEKPFFKAMPNV